MNLLVFARAPRRGRVKTRLAAEVGPDVALSVYRRMGRACVDNLRGVCPITVYHDPADAEYEVREWLDVRECRAQTAGDLGDRMKAATEDHFAKHPDRPVAVIGVDAPELTAEVLRKAAEQLDEWDVVVGPARDGGYYLIGLRRPCPLLFEEVAWGTESVLATTLERCRTLGMSVAMLPELRDVDTAEDARVAGLL